MSARLASRAVLNTLLVLGARTFSRLVSLVVVLAMANHLGASDYGRYTTAVAYSGLLGVLSDLGLNTLYTREAARDRDRLPAFLANLLSGKLALSVVAAVALGAALSVVGLWSVALAVVVNLLVNNYANLLRNTFYAVGRLQFEAIAVLSETVIQALLIVYGIRHGAGVSYFFLAYAASYAVTALYSLVVIPLFGLGAIRFAFDPRLFWQWVKVAYPIGIGYWLTTVYFKVDVPILQHFRQFREVGWYQLGYKPFEALQFVPLALQSVVYPLLGVYHRESWQRLQSAYERFFKVLLILGWPLTVGTFILVHPIGRLFRLFPESEPALRLLAFAIVFLFVNSAFVAMLYSIDRQDLFAWTTAIAVLVNVVSNLLLIPFFGYLAAAADTVLTEAAFSVAAWWFVRRTHPLPWLRDGWRVLAGGLVMGVVLLVLQRRSIFISAPAGAVTYAAMLFALRAVTPMELRLLARGLRLTRA